MGSGIAQVAATAGFHTIVFDLNKSVLEKAGQSIRDGLDKAVSKGRMTETEKEHAWRNLLFTGDIHQCLADVFIEAILEKMESKVALFNQLAELNHSECLFASNTSSLSLTELAGKIQNPERVIGLHFFNPAPVMKLVEVIHTKYNSNDTVETVMQLAREMGKTPVRCIDSPGFIVNRVARPYYIESLRLVEKGLADMPTIDRLLEATGFPMGPFRLMDLIGNDVNFAVSHSVYEQLGRPDRLRPSSLQQEKVEKGQLGRKTKKGYYDYE